VSAAWGSVLDALERNLEGVEAALEAGVEVVVGDLAVPEDLGTLPDTVRLRAVELQRRMAGVERSLTLAAQRARQAMILGDSSPNAGPSLFDARG
jgi:hypothetical protein